MESYNGFTGNERARVAALQRRAIQAGEHPAPQQCELCLKSTGKLHLHNEDYSRPFEDAHPICWACHSALHVRFTNPDRWAKRKQIIRTARLEAGVHPEGGWWEELALEPIDINPRSRPAEGIDDPRATSH